MKAISFSKHGEVDVLTYGEIATPTPKPGEALIEVHFAALNHLDIWVRRGWKGLQLTFPHVTGSDIVGRIAAISDTQSSFKTGDMVLVYPGINIANDEWTDRGEPSVSPGFRVIGEHVSGGLAEYVCVPGECLSPLPSSFAPSSFAALPVVAQTCWRMLQVLTSVKQGDTVLVVGAGGGVNSLSIQLCHSFGATVFTLAGSQEKAIKAAQLGADEVLEYKENPDWHKWVLQITNGRGVDYVIDNVGSATFMKSLKALRAGGTLLTVGNTSGPVIEIDNRLLFGKQLQILGSTMGSKKDFDSAIAYLIQNNIEPTIDCIAPLSSGIDQIRRMEQGQQFGKIVLDCKS